MATIQEFCPITGRARELKNTAYQLPSTGEYLREVGYRGKEAFQIDLTARRELYELAAGMIDTIVTQSMSLRSQRGEYGLVYGKYPLVAPVRDVPLSFPHVGDMVSDTIGEDTRVYVKRLKEGEGEDRELANFHRFSRILSWRQRHIQREVYTSRDDEFRIIPAEEMFIRRGANTHGSFAAAVSGSIPELYLRKHSILPNLDTFSQLQTHASPALYEAALFSLGPFSSYQDRVEEEVSVDQNPFLFALGITDSTRLSEEGKRIYQEYVAKFLTDPTHPEEIGNHGCPAMVFFNSKNAIDKGWELFQPASQKVYEQWLESGNKNFALLRNLVEEK